MPQPLPQKIADQYYEAVLARDPRFDGKFFVGVKTTGIYCRPICPAKPLRRNIEFYASAPLAERAGYRPCLRCRPESAPQSPAWIGSSASVQRALKLLAQGDHSEIGEEAFAARLGMSARHLRRLFENELGRTPKQIADSQRLNFARKLISETLLPITEIALNSGFASIRRFNDAFQKRFHRSPSEIRKGSSRKAQPSGVSRLEISLAFRPPLDWKSLLGYFEKHQVAGSERIVGEEFQRVFRSGEGVGALSIRPGAVTESSLRLTLYAVDLPQLHKIVQKTRHCFDLDSDPLVVANSLSRSPFLGRLTRKFPGLRAARSWDPFEGVCSAILGQLVSTERASQMMREIAQCYGEPVKHPIDGDAATLFPSPQTIAESTLGGISCTTARKNTLRQFARLVCDGKISLDDAQDLEIFRRDLRTLKGIGPWTAEIISLRALGDVDAFPASDLILKRALDRHPSLCIEDIRPWRAYGATYLWREYARSLSAKKETRNG